MDHGAQFGRPAEISRSAGGCFRAPFLCASRLAAAGACCYNDGGSASEARRRREKRLHSTVSPSSSVRSLFLARSPAARSDQRLPLAAAVGGGRLTQMAGPDRPSRALPYRRRARFRLRPRRCCALRVTRAANTARAAPPMIPDPPLPANGSPPGFSFFFFLSLLSSSPACAIGFIARRSLGTASGVTRVPFSGLGSDPKDVAATPRVPYAVVVRRRKTGRSPEATPPPPPPLGPTVFSCTRRRTRPLRNPGFS